MSDLILVDTHAHLDMKDFNKDRDRVVKRAKESGLAAIVNASINLESSRRLVAMAGEYTGMYAMAGIHPHDVKEAPARYLDELRLLAQDPAAVAIGEIGLDYFRDLSPRPLQQRIFREQLALARELEIPVVIHDREAHGDIMDIFKRDGVPRPGGILHCFSGSWDMARECMKIGFYISIAGPVTYPNSVKLKNIASRLPLDRILVETDCPFLPPQTFRGQRNEPGNVKYVLEEVARLREMPAEQLALAVAANAAKIFNIEIPGI